MCVEWAGVGFVAAPSARKNIAGFCQLSNRIASLKIQTCGGVAVLMSVYALHNLKDVGEKWAFYEDLGGHLHRMSANGV